MAVAISRTANPLSTTVSIAGNVGTYSGQAIGTASSDRIVVLCVGTEVLSGTINSATIDFGSGDTAMKAGAQATFGNNSARCFYLNVTSGTTATFKITFGVAPTTTNQHISVYVATGAYLSVSSGGHVSTDMDSSAPLTAQFNVITTGGASGKIDIPTNGGLLACASCATDTVAKTWAGATEDLDEDAGDLRWTTATTTTGGSTAITCTGATNAEDGAMSWVMFHPNTGAFGELKGVAGIITANVTNPLTPLSALTVAVGDLIVVSYGEQTASTATGCTDSLGNSYTPLTTGTLIESYFSIITVAGDCLPSIATTGGTNDASICVALFNGPFDSTPLDANPAVTSDAAEPYSCNATGTLAQADELIVGMFATSIGETGYDTPGPSATIAVNTVGANGPNISGVMTYLVVSSTATVTMSIGGVVGTRTTNCCVATFKKQAAAAAAPFNQEDWPLPRFESRVLSWTQNLLQSTLTLAVAAPAPFRQLDWPLPRVEPRFGSWTQNLLQSTLTPAVAAVNIVLPFDWGTPDGPARPADFFSWLVGPSLNLRAAVVVAPFNQDDWPTPRGYEYALPLRTWTLNLQQSTLRPFPVGDQLYVRPELIAPQLLRSWTWNYNLNLIGQDQFPAGEQRYDLTPAGYIHPTQLRTWVAFTNLALVAPPAQRPFSQIDWPLPRAPQQAAFGYAWSYNLNLIGQDRLPTGAKLYDLAPRDYQRPHIFTWTWNYNYNLIGQDALPVGEQRLELAPVGHIHPQQLRTWIDFRSRAVDFVAGAQPDGKRSYDLPPRDDRPYALRSWTFSYNLNLIGKDQLPVGKQTTELPPRIAPAAIQTWINQAFIALSSPVAPFKQTDWPVPRAASQPQRSWTASYNLNLIGQDRLPVGETIFELAPRGFIYPTSLRTFVRQLNLALVIAPAPLPKNQYDWPLPVQPRHPLANRSWINVSPIDFIALPPPVISPRDPTHARARSGFEVNARGLHIDQRGSSIDKRGTPIDRRGSDTPRRGRNES